MAGLDARDAKSVTIEDARLADAADEHGWPVWPPPSPSLGTALGEVVRSGRWSISGFATGSHPRERIFAEAFAAWNGNRFCTPTSNGTAALVAALESLDIGPGDEVIVPALTWVAPAIAVLQVGATPVFADIDSETLSLSVEAVRGTITPQTRAVIAVHLYCSTVDLDALVTLARSAGLKVIEDCAQSHGTVWRDRKVGGFGDVGIFSMHQGKLLTSGEGGALVTDDPILAARAEELRLNGRRFADPPAPAGEFDLVEAGTVLGSNLALSEFQAAILLDGLQYIDGQNARRSRAAAFLDRELSSVEGLRPIGRPEQVRAQSYYHYLIRFDPEAFAHRPPEVLAAWLTKELGCPWTPVYPPMNRHPLYQPLGQKRYCGDARRLSQLDPRHYHLPCSDAAYSTSLITPHRILLAEPAMLARIPEAFRRLQRLAGSLA
ncbi:MAG TPA: DegT/DnrJ/EryC1/StrS family aminotransferase [Propylenella sp.]|nr:DegT/DnrJ/EryC1/StrS family aminotransferase [Propylenella sp.]